MRTPVMGETPVFAAWVRLAVGSYQEHEMASVDRVTVTLPKDLVRDIDRREKHRSNEARRDV